MLICFCHQKALNSDRHSEDAVGHHKLKLLSDGVWVSWFWYITEAKVYLVPVPTCPKRSNISHNALQLSHTQYLCIHNKCWSLFSASKKRLYSKCIVCIVSEELSERCMGWVLSGVWSQGERGPTGPPGIQGETGIGLPGPKVNIVIL